MCVWYKKSPAQEARQKSDILDYRSKGWRDDLLCNRSLYHCAICEGSSYSKNKYNFLIRN